MENGNQPDFGQQDFENDTEADAQVTSSNEEDEDQSDDLTESSNISNSSNEEPTDQIYDIAITPKRIQAQAPSTRLYIDQVQAPSTGSSRPRGNLNRPHHLHQTTVDQTTNKTKPMDPAPRFQWDEDEMSEEEPEVQPKAQPEAQPAQPEARPGQSVGQPTPPADQTENNVWAFYHEELHHLRLLLLRPSYSNNRVIQEIFDQQGHRVQFLRDKQLEQATIRPESGIRAYNVATLNCEKWTINSRVSYYTDEPGIFKGLDNMPISLIVGGPINTNHCNILKIVQITRTNRSCDPATVEKIKKLRFTKNLYMDLRGELNAIGLIKNTGMGYQQYNQLMETKENEKNDTIVTGHIQLYRLNSSNSPENLLASHQLDISIDLVESLTQYGDIQSVLHKERSRPRTSTDKMLFHQRITEQRHRDNQAQDQQRHESHNDRNHRRLDQGRHQIQSSQTDQDNRRRRPYPEEDPREERAYTNHEDARERGSRGGWGSPPN